MSAGPTRLLLFDIDGTLILGGGAGEGALFQAMQDCFGLTGGFDRINMAGATDKAIAMELLSANELEPSPENIAKLLDRYLEVLEEKLPQQGGILLPGIVELLEDLTHRADCVLGLLTGNIRKGAEIKLQHFGVWHFFSFGAFADDHHDRNQLGDYAKARALEHHGEEFPPERIYVIGDTPKDIACGKAFGARTVAIATGKYPLQELAAHQPDFLFADLSQPAKVIEALFAEAPVG